MINVHEHRPDWDCQLLAIRQSCRALNLDLPLQFSLHGMRKSLSLSLMVSASV